MRVSGVGMEKLLERWNKLPEWARWTLLIPALILGTIPIGLLARVAVWAAPALLPPWAWAQLVFGRIVAPFAVASFFAAYEYEMLFALTPHRGRGAVGWVFFVGERSTTGVVSAVARL